MTSPRSSYHHGDLRSSLLRAAIDIAREKGLDAVTMRSVAKRTGVSEAAPYHHFSNKADLLANAAVLAFTDFGAALEQGVKASRTADQEPLLGLVAAYVGWGLGHPGEYRLMFGRHVVDLAIDTREDAQAAGGASIRIAIETIRDSLTRRNSPAAAEEAFILVRALVHGIVSLVQDNELGPDMTTVRAINLAQQAVEALLDGLR